MRTTRKATNGNDLGTAAVRGVGPSITPPADLQSAQRDKYRRTGGEDWFEVMVYLRWGGDEWAALRETLDAAKDEAANPEGVREAFVTLPGSGGTWKVHPQGCRLGGENGPVCRWRFERDGIVFGLIDRADPHETLPSGFVRMTGEAIIALGDAESMWNRVLVWLHELGAEVVGNKLSRVDMCVDLPGTPIDQLMQAMRDGRVFRRTRKRTEHGQVAFYGMGRKDTGFTLGAGTLLRVYDKAIECRDIAKRAWMIARRWNGEDQDTACRVEFQLNREFLAGKKLKPSKTGQINRPAIDTVEDYFDHRGQLARYLMQSWIRFCEPDGFDARHPERATTLTLWREVEAAMLAWTDATDLGQETFRPLPRSAVSKDQLVSQIRGVGETLAAKLGVEISGPDDFLGFITHELHTAIESDTRLSERIENKRNRTALVVADAEADRDLVDIAVATVAAAAQWERENEVIPLDYNPF